VLPISLLRWWLRLSIPVLHQVAREEAGRILLECMFQNGALNSSLKLNADGGLLVRDGSIMVRIFWLVAEAYSQFDKWGKA